MDKEEAFDYSQHFAANLLEYVTMIAGKDYETREACIENIAGDEKKFWDALEVLNS